MEQEFYDKYIKPILNRVLERSAKPSEVAIYPELLKIALDYSKKN